MTTRPICLLFLLLAACGSDGIAVPEGAAAPDACASCTTGAGGTLVADAAPSRPDAPVSTPSDAAAERREPAACSAILCIDEMLRGVDCSTILSSCDGNCQAYLACNEACIADSGVDYDSGPCMENCTHSGFDGAPGGPVANQLGAQYLACTCCGTAKPDASTGSGGSLTDACAACADAQPEASPGTGGNAQTGGSTGSGGSTGTGGLTGSGGIVDAGSGGSAETGGATSTGGATGTGGATQPPPEFPGPDGGGTWLDWPFCIDTVNEPDTSCCRNTPYGTYMHVLLCHQGVIPPHPPCWHAVGTTYVCDQHR